MSDCVRKVSDCARKVLDGVRKVSDGVGKVSDGVGKVSDGVGKASYGIRNMSDCTIRTTNRAKDDGNMQIRLLFFGEKYLKSFVWCRL